MWRNHYRSALGKFSTQSEWPSREEAEKRAAYLLQQLAAESGTWAQSVQYLGPQAVAGPA